MENRTPDVDRALTKISQALDKLHSTRLFLPKDSPEWQTVLRAEREVFLAMNAIEKKANPLCSSVAYYRKSATKFSC